MSQAALQTRPPSQNHPRPKTTKDNPPPPPTRDSVLSTPDSVLSTPDSVLSPQDSSPERLITLYLDPDLTLADMAFTLGLSIPELLDLTERDEFKALLERYADAHRRRAAYLADAALVAAARTFSRLAETCDKPETARKAAGALVRMSHPPPADSPQESVPRATDSPSEGNRCRAPRATDSPQESVPRQPASEPAPTATPSPRDPPHPAAPPP